MTAGGMLISDGTTDDGTSNGGILIAAAAAAADGTTEEGINAGGASPEDIVFALRLAGSITSTSDGLPRLPSCDIMMTRRR